MLPMAPRRNHNSNSNSIVHHQQQQHQQQQHQHIIEQQQQAHVLDEQTQQQQHQHQQQHQQTRLLASNFFNVNSSIDTDHSNIMSPMQSATASNNNNSNSNNTEQYTRCCYPNGDCFKIDTLICLNNLDDCVHVICSNENCNVGQYMHRDCFESWEQSLLVTLKSNGRARSWSERQRSQNLWTKKGYDLVYKVCGCKCGRGHIRKDLEWSVSSVTKTPVHYVGGNNNANVQQQQRIASSSVAGGVGGGNNNCNDDDEKKKKKKRSRNNQKPSLASSLNNASGYHPNCQQQQQQQQQQNAQTNFANVLANSSNSYAQNLASNSHIGSQPVSTIAPNPNVGVIGSGLHHNNSNTQQQQQQQQQQTPQMQPQQQQNLISPPLSNISNGNVLGLDLHTRAGSLSSSGGSGTTSPSASQSSIETPISPIHHTQQLQQQQQQQQQQVQHMQLQQYQQSLLQQNGLSKSILNGINGCVSNIALLSSAKQQQQPPPMHVGNSSSLNALTLFDQQLLVQQQKNKEVELYSERVRSTSGCNGIFSRRLDFSSFNLLPKTRLNSYQVKIEDEGNHGNDDTRLFILSSLAQSQMSRVACILCEEPMLVFDRYPLVDGSFFLSPKQHSPGCIEVKYEGRVLFLTCVCMGCLDGTSTNRVINCRFCGEVWDGSNLVLGTMYSYDIFAALPCCAERLKCNNCFKMLLHPQQRLNFYSDYSHCVTCPYCTTQDTHFVKPLSFCYTKSFTVRHQAIA